MYSESQTILLKHPIRPLKNPDEYKRDLTTTQLHATAQKDTLEERVRCLMGADKSDNYFGIIVKTSP